MQQSKKKKRTSARKNFWSFGQISSSLNILSPILIYTISFGRLQNFAVPVKLKFQKFMLKNLWTLLRKFTICFGKQRAEKFLGFVPVEIHD